MFKLGLPVFLMFAMISQSFGQFTGEQKSWLYGYNNMFKYNISVQRTQMFNLGQTNSNYIDAVRATVAPPYGCSSTLDEWIAAKDAYDAMRDEALHQHQPNIDLYYAAKGELDAAEADTVTVDELINDPYADNSTTEFHRLCDMINEAAGDIVEKMFTNTTPPCYRLRFEEIYNKIKEKEDLYKAKLALLNAAIASKCGNGGPSPLPVPPEE